MAKKKQLSISKQLLQEVSIYDEFIEIPVNNGDEEYTLIFYPLFKPEKVTHLVKELKEYQYNAQEENVVITDDELIDTVGYFIVKHFTNIQTTKSKKATEINKEIKILKNTRIYKDLMSYFPKESVQSVMEYIEELQKQILLLQEEFEKGVRQIQELDIKNKELIFNNNK